MKAIIYRRHGDPSVLVGKPILEPDDGEVRIRVLVSGVDPTDWKSRSSVLLSRQFPTTPVPSSWTRSGRECETSP